MPACSASFDTTVKVWDGRKGSCIFTLAAHTALVYSVEFSHDGAYLASGSLDRCFLVWSMEVSCAASFWLEPGGGAHGVFPDGSVNEDSSRRGRSIWRLLELR